MPLSVANVLAGTSGETRLYLSHAASYVSLVTCSTSTVAKLTKS